MPYATYLFVRDKTLYQIKVRNLIKKMKEATTFLF
jgi:hypothetical protein